ncbi:hypothetical protein CN271_16005, partial [Bacillus cereus]
PNAKDGLYTPLGRVDTVLQNLDIGLSIRTALGILQMILAARSPALGRAAGLINLIFGFLWGTLGGQKTWESFMKAVEALVDQKITDAVRAKALSELEGVQNAVILYQEAADDWNENPNDESNKERVRRQFTSTNTVMEFAIPSFRALGFEVPLLTVYAQATNLHLQLLRDAVKFGTEWGMPSAEVEDLYTRLTRRTAEYTDHCVTTYDKGLKQAYDLAPNPTDYNKYPYLNPYSKDPIYGKYYTAPVDWNLFNDYRRNMTLMVLDIVAVWPTYNPRIYTNPNGTQIELSREVYSTVYGRGGSNNSSVDAIESQIVRPPHLVTELTTLKIEQGSTLDMEQIQYPKYMKVTNTLHYIGSSSTWEQSSSAPPIRPITKIHTIPANNIGNLSLSQLDVPYRFSFYNKDDTLIAEVGAEFPPNTVTWNGIEKAEDSNQNSHRLSYVGALGTQSSAGFPWTYPTELLGEWGFGWLHNSLTPENRVGVTTITQIPAVKAYWMEQGAQVVKGPGSTGGDVIQLPVNGIIRINLTSINPQRNYSVRVRYAATANGRLNFSRIDSFGTIQSTSTEYVTTGAGANASSFTYNQFQYVDIDPSDSTQVYTGIILVNEMGGPIYIDKIEFIPLSQIIEPPQLIPDGSYQIITALNNRSAVQAIFKNVYPRLNNLELWEGSSFKWNFVYNAGRDAYQIFTADGGALTRFNEISTDRDPVFVRQNLSTDNQFWKIYYQNDGYFVIRNLDSALDVWGYSTANGTTVDAYRYHGGINQKFRLLKV